MEKTNVMRILDQHKIQYISHCYINTPSSNGEEIAKILNENPNQVFKTLVTVSNKNQYFVFVIPVNKELDLKKAATVTQVKKIEMIPQKQLLPLTGYVHGGCSPLGMKKKFPTFFDESAKKYPTIFFSAGKVGYQVECHLEDLSSLLSLKYASLTKE